MKFIKFTIENFKGIENTAIDLSPAGANIFSLIGLNESGKTTILEAINAFNLSGEEASELYGQKNDKINPSACVPKSLKFNFTGKIIIRAVVLLSQEDKEFIISSVLGDTKARISLSSIPNEITMIRGFVFSNSDYTKTIREIHCNFEYIPDGKRKAVSQIEKNVWDNFCVHFHKRLPKIIYFPTFLFTQPDKIILNPGSKESGVNKLYRDVITNIALSLNRDLDIKKHIVDRILGEETLYEKVINFAFMAPDKREQVEATLNEMSSHLTDTIFSN